MKKAAALALVLASCGASSPPARTDAARWPEEAQEAWSALDASRAATVAERALRLDPDDALAREIAARSNLASGHFERAERALEGANEPLLLRLRARAQIALGRFGEAHASLEAARRAGDDDPWSESVLGALRAARDLESPYAVEGANEVSLALEALPLPVVRVRTDMGETLALIGTGADFAVLDPSAAAESGVLDELTLGAMRVRHIPFVTRSLAPLREALEAEVTMVIGGQLLLRLSATLDGPGQRLVLRATPPPADGSVDAPLLTPGGSFLVAPVRVGEARTWMTLDSAGLFPIALAPDVELGIAESEWRALDGDRSLAITTLRIGDLQVEDVPFVRGLLDEDHARAVGAPVAGSVGWMLLGQTAIRFDPRGRRILFE